VRSSVQGMQRGDLRYCLPGLEEGVDGEERRKAGEMECVLSWVGQRVALYDFDTRGVEGEEDVVEERRVRGVRF
jgi:hypothetical protein